MLAPLWSPGTFFAPVSLPFGAIVARCELTGLAQMCGEGYIRTLDTRVIFKPSRQELASGDYTPGRYAWLLSDVQAPAHADPSQRAARPVGGNETQKRERRHERVSILGEVALAGVGLANGPEYFYGLCPSRRNAKATCAGTLPWVRVALV